MENKVYDVVEGLIQKLKTTQEENVEKTARLFADALKNGGMLQAFGSGHSQAGASELCFRAGGFIPTKQIKEPASGAYEGIEGVGTSFMKKVDVRPNDVVVLISNSGRDHFAGSLEEPDAEAFLRQEPVAAGGCRHRQLRHGRGRFDRRRRSGHPDLRHVRDHHGDSDSGLCLPHSADAAGRRHRSASLQISEHRRRPGIQRSSVSTVFRPHVSHVIQNQNRLKGNSSAEFLFSYYNEDTYSRCR